MATATTARRIRSDREIEAWVVGAAQLVYAALFIACAYLALARAAHFAGHFYIPSEGDRYTADADIVDGWPWAGLVSGMAGLGGFFAVCSVIVSTILLVFGGLRARRGLWVMLLISTLAVLATIVVSLTPAGRSVIGWVQD